MSTTMPRSALRHRPIAPDVQEWSGEETRVNRRKQQQEPHTIGGMPSPKSHSPALIIITLSMLITFLLLWTGQGILAWGNALLDEMRYGSPRTTQVDHYVGHETTQTASHFTAMNVNGQIYILEIPGGNASASQLLIGPHLFGAGADLVPVVLVFQGDPRHPDLLVEVNAIQMRFQNTGKRYVPTMGYQG